MKPKELAPPTPNENLITAFLRRKDSDQIQTVKINLVKNYFGF